ncbi:MAG: pyridoxal kinase PdxY [Rhodospirillales bacterium]|nr:pyridoxal kinase PdxY [Rhodospirillales bacterium]
MSILSVQSSVSYGHVGNAAAVFPLQRLGFEVWPVDTVLYSNHPGYGAFEGVQRSADEIAALIRGIAARGALGECQAVLSGYLGKRETGMAVAEAVRMVREANPDSVYCCDPVMGDTAEGLYVSDDIPALFRDHLIPMAEIVTPNAFELTELTGLSTASVTQVRAAAGALVERGVSVVMVTSLCFCKRPEDCTTIETMAITRNSAWRVVTPRLDLRAKGAGDALAALFLGHYLLGGKDARTALSKACSGLYGVIEATVEAKGRELHLVAAQDQMTSPSRSFPAELVL